MYGGDSFGRKVSLLNDEPSAGTSPAASRPSDNFPHKSTSTELSPIPITETNRRLSRYSSSPEASARTPPLERHGSVASLGSQSTVTSPTTPSYPFDPLEQQKKSNPYYAYQRPHLHLYPTISNVPGPLAQTNGSISAQPVPDLDLEDSYAQLNPVAPPPLQTQFPFASTDQTLIGLSPASVASSPLTVSSATQASQPILPTKAAKLSTTIPIAAASKPAVSPTSEKIKYRTICQAPPTRPSISRNKKKFPCPYSILFSCTDTFSTSGHAARHGKKHTGQKPVACSTCNKAFTRKDNMKQHERTHKKSSSCTSDGNSSATGAGSSTTESAAKGAAPAPSMPGHHRGARSRSKSPSAARGEPAGTNPSALDGMDFALTSSVSKNETGSGDRRPGLGVRINSKPGGSEEDGEGERPWA
ncbi:MAG: hypothetical protein Q9190_007915 [Brigantiaea leucoxantha]